MSDRTEEELNSMTLVGWFVLAANMLTCCVAVPLIFFYLCPEILDAGGRTQRYALVAGFLILGGVGFLVSQWLLEKCGVTIFRKPPR